MTRTALPPRVPSPVLRLVGVHQKGAAMAELRYEIDRGEPT